MRSSKSASSPTTRSAPFSPRGAGIKALCRPRGESCVARLACLKNLLTDFQQTSPPKHLFHNLVNFSHRTPTRPGKNSPTHLDGMINPECFPFVVCRLPTASQILNPCRHGRRRGDVVRPGVCNVPTCTFNYPDMHDGCRSTELANVYRHAFPTCQDQSQTSGST